MEEKNQTGYMVVLCATIVALVLGITYFIKGCVIESNNQKIEMMKLETQKINRK